VGKPSPWDNAAVQAGEPCWPSGPVQYMAGQLLCGFAGVCRTMATHGPPDDAGGAACCVGAAERTTHRARAVARPDGQRGRISGRRWPSRRGAGCRRRTRRHRAVAALVAVPLSRAKPP
jgi:hypothetical protein